MPFWEESPWLKQRLCDVQLCRYRYLTALSDSIGMLNYIKSGYTCGRNEHSIPLFNYKRNVENVSSCHCWEMTNNSWKWAVPAIVKAISTLFLLLDKLKWWIFLLSEEKVSSITKSARGSWCFISKLLFVFTKENNLMSLLGF